MKCFEKIDKRQNQKVDDLSKDISKVEIGGIMLEHLSIKSTDGEVMCMEVEDNWMTPIKECILNNSLLMGDSEDWKLRVTVARYVIENKDPYRTMGDWPLLKCVHQEERNYILGEMNEGICKAHNTNTLA